MERTITVRVDDFDRTTAGGRHTFALDDDIYDIDLHDAHAVELHREFNAAFARFIKVARSRSKPYVKLSPEQLSAIRVWCRANGYPDISDYGVIPRDAKAAFDAAHPPTKRADTNADEVAAVRSKRMFSDSS